MSIHSNNILHVKHFNSKENSIIRKLSEEEAQERFEDADLDKDGKVTWKEQLQDSFGDESEFDETSSEDEIVSNRQFSFKIVAFVHINFYYSQLIKADKRLFQGADLNKDGALDVTEYRRFCNPEDFADMLPILIQNTLEEKDLNKDGYIDFEEFIGDKGNIRIFCNLEIK